MSYSNEQSIDSLISAPLVAASKANAMMTTGQVRFLMENCFEKQDDGSYTPVMIKMTLQSSAIHTDNQSENGFSIASRSIGFQVPVISLLPLNSLVVDSLNVDFGLDITSVRSGKTREQYSAEGKLSGTVKKTAVMSGRISRTTGGKSRRNRNERIHINMSFEVKSQPLPEGTRTLLDLYTKTITPLPSQQ